MFDKSPDHNINYLATIVKIDTFRPHCNADRLKIATVFSNNVITSIDAEPGLYVYFPLECAISTEYLSWSNSFRDVSKNKDETKKGMFDNNRVRCVSLRGEKSEGYIVPVSSLERFVADTLNTNISISDWSRNTDFDTICGHLICKKYIPRGTKIPNVHGKKCKGNVKKYQSKLVENQFAFHQDTGALKREVNKVDPDDYIAITNKLHGTNFIVSNVLVKRKLSFIEKIAKLFKVRVVETEYGNLYASRTVIKNRHFETENTVGHFYDSDVWKIVSDKVYPFLSEGISVVGEIVGFTPKGGAVQKSYDYSCGPNELDFYVFKVTYTSPKGQVYTFSYPQMLDWCKKYDIKTPETFFYGKAKDLFPELDIDQHWHQNFLEKLMDKYLEKKCHICKNDVWAEGVVLRIDKPFEWEAYKLKSYNFLGYESKLLDEGVQELDAEVTEEENLGLM